MNPRQISNELFIPVRLGPAQLVIEVNDKKNNPQITPQIQQEPQQRDRIDATGNGDTDAISGLE